MYTDHDGVCVYVSECMFVAGSYCLLFFLLFVVVAGHLHFAVTGDCWL